MTNDMLNPFTDRPPTTKFEDAYAGTLLEVTGQDFPTPTAGTVVQLLKEFGSTKIPALLIKFQGEDEPRLVTSSGRNHIRIIRGTKSIAGQNAPDAAVRANLIPKTVTAVQFVGGAARATEIIQWAAGRASVSYYQQDGLEPEYMLMHALNQDTRISIGDWLVLDDETFKPYSNDDFLAAFDIDPAQLGLHTGVLQ